MSSLSSMSNFFRVTDSPFSGVIPSSVLRQAMEKRQNQIDKENSATGGEEQKFVTPSNPSKAAASEEVKEYLKVQ